MELELFWHSFFVDISLYFRSLFLLIVVLSQKESGSLLDHLQKASILTLKVSRSTYHKHVGSKSGQSPGGHPLI